jgi:hypothetical protein
MRSTHEANDVGVVELRVDVDLARHLAAVE